MVATSFAAQVVKDVETIRLLLRNPQDQQDFELAMNLVRVAFILDRIDELAERRLEKSRWVQMRAEAGRIYDKIPVPLPRAEEQ